MCERPQISGRVFYRAEPDAERGWWYSIDGAPAKGPFRERMNAGFACRGDIIKMAEAREKERPTEDPDDPDTWGGDPADFRYLGWR